MNTLADLRRHLVLEAGVDADQDVLVEGYISSATDHIQRYLRRDLAADYGGDVPPGILQAHRLLVAHFYYNREAEKGEDSMPYSVMCLLADFRRFV